MGVLPPGGSTQSPSPLTYDAAGDVTIDTAAANQYLYDADGRICAVSRSMTGYLYDAEGRRIAKGTIQNMNTCDPAPVIQGGNGFQLTATYGLDTKGNQVTEMDADGSSLNWQHTNVWAGGALLATYDSAEVHFYFNDPLGNRRVQTHYDGAWEQNCYNLPYGNALYCTDSLTTPTEHHFTGKERDDESGNDYFGARYYSSITGRFISPDWAAKATAVPYAQFGNPQSLNLYAYVGNNPLRGVDADGHGEDDDPLGDISDMEDEQDNEREMDDLRQKQAQQQMTTSAAGVAFIKGWEGWNGTYDKATGKWLPKDDGFGNGTIGWGHNCGKCADFAGGITKAEGDALLTKDLGRFEGAVNGLGANLSQQQFDGLVAFAFNVRNFGGSTLFSNVASGNAVTEANFTAYGNARNKQGVLVHVPSIYRRRESEWNVYANGVYDSSH